MLNREKWDAYLASGGKALAELFEKSLTGTCQKDFAGKMLALHKRFCPSKALQERIYNQLIDFIDDAEDVTYFVESAAACSIADSNASATDIIRVFLYGKDDEPASDKEFFKDFEESLAYTTTFLASRSPERFIPYYFQCNFNVLTAIAGHFGIALPPLPDEKDYRGRVEYYAALSNALLRFGKENGMTPFELDAFLYDYAPAEIGADKNDSVQQGSQPHTVYLMSMERYDDCFSDKPDAVIPWHCSPETRPGDSVLLYLRTPDNALHSRWICLSEPFIDPFYYPWYCAYAGKPELIKTISLRWMQKDKIMCHNPLVHRNMEGCDGKALTEEEVERLREMEEEKEK
jgi:hypothetical protein